MNRGDGFMSRSITVNDGRDGAWPITSDAGLMAIEQPIMQIATRNAQASPTMPLNGWLVLKLVLVPIGRHITRGSGWFHFGLYV
jgi:hypothetical protein